MKFVHLNLKIFLGALLLGITGASFAFAYGDKPATIGGQTACAFEPAGEKNTRLDRFGDPLPEGALARFGTVRWRQGWMVMRVLFSPDGKKLALAGCGRPVGLWDLAGGKEIRQFHQRNNQPSGVAFSPDGNTIAEGDVAVRLWDTRTGSLRHEMAAQASQRAVVFTPDGRMVISGGHDNLIHLWDSESGESLGKLEGHTASVLTLALTKDGSTLASAGGDKSIRLWSLAARKQMGELKGPTGGSHYCHEISFSPDGRWLVSAAEDGQAPARVWDVPARQERFQLAGKGSQARTVSFSPDGKLIASGHMEGTVRLWDSATGKEVRHWSCRVGIGCLAFSPDGRTLATLSVWQSGPRLWDVATGKEIGSGDTHHGMISQICLTGDGKSLLSLSRDRQVIQWDLAMQTPGLVMELPFGKRWNDYYPHLAADGRVLAQASRLDRTVSLIDPATQKPLRTPLHLKDEPYFLRFSPDRRTLAIGCQKGGFYLWEYQGDAAPRRIDTPEKDLITILAFMPDGKQVVTGSMNPNNLLIHLWDVATGKRVFSFPGNNLSPVCAISPDGKWAAGAGHADRTIHVIDVPNRKEVGTLTVGHGIASLAFSPDGQFLAYGQYENEGGNIGLVDFATGEPLALFQGHHSGVIPLLFTADGRSLFSGGGDSTILHWDATGRLGKKPFHANLDTAWEALAGAAKPGYRARWDFLDSADEALTLFRRQIRPVGKTGLGAFERWVMALDSGSFAERQKAAGAIKAMGFSGEPLLRKQLQRKNSLESRRRLQDLHDQLVKSATWRRTKAVLDIARAMNTDAGRDFLRDLAAGYPEALLTIEARKALPRKK